MDILRNLALRTGFLPRISGPATRGPRRIFTVPKGEFLSETSARGAEISLQKRLYIKAICRILRIPLFQRSPDRFLGGPLRRSKSGNFENPCSTLSFLDQNLRDFRTGDARAAKDFQGSERGFQKGSQAISKVLKNDRVYSAGTQKIVLSLYRIQKSISIEQERSVLHFLSTC